MEIVRENEQKVRLEKLNSGDTFLYDDALYMKIESGDVNNYLEQEWFESACCICVNLDENVLDVINIGIAVKPVKAKVVV